MYLASSFVAVIWVDIGGQFYSSQLIHPCACPLSAATQLGKGALQGILKSGQASITRSTSLVTKNVPSLGLDFAPWKYQLFRLFSVP